MLLSKEHPQVIHYRSTEPVLMPVLPQERHGTLPTLCSPRPSTGETIWAQTAATVYYGMADYRIGVARLDVPDFLPPEGVADPAEAKV